MRNTAGVGTTAALLDMDLSYFEELMRESMSGEMLEANKSVLHDAYQRSVQIS